MNTRSHSGAQRAVTTTGAVVSPLARATLLAVILSFIPLIGLSQTRISGSQLRLTTRLVTSTSDTITQADCGRLVSYRNAGAMTATLPDASSLPVGCWMDLQNAGPGTVSLSGQSTIDGQTSISLTVNQGVRLVSTGLTYLSQRGQGQGAGTAEAITYNAGPSGALAIDSVNHTVDIASGVVCLVSLACAPTNVFDLSGATVSKPAKNAAGDPANCGVSEKYFNTTTGKFRNCLTANTWTDENSGGAQISAGANMVNAAGVLSWVPSDPSTAWGQDEFCGGDNYAVGINQYGELGWQAHSDNTGAIVTYINGAANHPCIIHLSTDGSTAYGNEMLALISASAVKQMPPLNAGSYEFNFVFRMNQTGSSDLYVGLTGEGLGSEFSDVNDIYLRYNTGDNANWQFRSCVASSCTTTNTGAAADTNWHRLRLKSVSGSATICLDACASPTSIAGLPTGPMVPMFYLGNLSSPVARSVDIDFFSFQFSGLSRF